VLPGLHGFGLSLNTEGRPELISLGTTAKVWAWERMDETPLHPVRWGAYLQL